MTWNVGLDGLASHGMSGMTWIVRLDEEKQKEPMPSG